MLVLGGTSAVLAEPSNEARATVVLYNRNDPESRALAKFYAEKREIPFDQVLGLNCSSDEEITRDHYLVRIEAPLRDAFTKRDWWKIERDDNGRRFVASSNKRFVAIMRGVPMKIRSDEKVRSSGVLGDIKPGAPLEKLVQQNEASVDSELAALFSLLDEPPAFIPNPYFRRFTRIFETLPSQTPLLVCRLDGPSDEIVRKMITNAIETERTGLWGWSYIDARSIKSAGYVEGDNWLFATAKSMRSQGLPVITDIDPDVLPRGFPVTDAAVYYGWYTSEVTGVFAQPKFRFLPGAIAIHLHSFSARTIRDPNVAWAAPLLARGATVTMGNVYEPYLGLTVHFDVLQDRLMSGFTLGEAAYMAHLGLSWMNVIIGDPLYRPYASWSDFSTTDRPSIWQEYRSIVLNAGGDPIKAADDLRKLAEERKNSMPLEALGQAQQAEKKFSSALTSYREAEKIEKSTAIRFRLALEQIAVLRQMGDRDAAMRQLSRALEEFRSEEQQSVLGKLALKLNPGGGGS